jgi:structural maintenance of chromosome 3 (chondroitin sulfate proteoglycan 6)
MDVRKHTWRKAEELQERRKEALETLNKAVGHVRKSTMPRATAMRLKALRNIVEQEQIAVGQQYFGMVMENMTLKDPSKYQTAVEVSTQNALFHVIVDTDATAARLMKRLEDGKRGRVSHIHAPQPFARGSEHALSTIQRCHALDGNVHRLL